MKDKRRFATIVMVLMCESRYHLDELLPDHNYLIVVGCSVPEIHVVPGRGAIIEVDSSHKRQNMNVHEAIIDHHPYTVFVSPPHISPVSVNFTFTRTPSYWSSNASNTAVYDPSPARPRRQHHHHRSHALLASSYLHRHRHQHRPYTTTNPAWQWITSRRRHLALIMVIGQQICLYLLIQGRTH